MRRKFSPLGPWVLAGLITTGMLFWPWSGEALAQNRNCQGRQGGSSSQLTTSQLQALQQGRQGGSSSQLTTSQLQALQMEISLARELRAALRSGLLSTSLQSSAMQQFTLALQLASGLKTGTLTSAQLQTMIGA